MPTYRMATSGRSISGSQTFAMAYTSPEPNSRFYAILHDSQIGTEIQTVTWQPQGTSTGQQAMTKIQTQSAVLGANTQYFALFRLNNPSAATGAGGANGKFSIGSLSNGSTLFGVFAVSNVTEDPVIQMATGVGASSAVAISAAPNSLVLDFVTRMQDGSTTAPSPTAGQTAVRQIGASGAGGGLDSGLGMGREFGGTNQTWNMAFSCRWFAAALSFANVAGKTQAVVVS